jgi:hypothetical protein
MLPAQRDSSVTLGYRWSSVGAAVADGFHLTLRLFHPSSAGIAAGALLLKDTWIMSDPSLFGSGGTLSDEQIGRLLTQRPITDRRPWASNDEGAVDDFYRALCDALCREAQLLARIEWDHYGSGYASFVDAWFYRDAPEFDIERVNLRGEERTGLVVLLNRLAPVYVLMEGEKRWHENGGSSYLPAYDGTDRFDSPVVAALAAEVQPILDRHGLQRLHREELAEALDPVLEVPTILGDRPYTQFDALFYWED